MQGGSEAVHHIRSTWQDFNNKKGVARGSCGRAAITLHVVDSQLCKTVAGTVGNRTPTLSHTRRQCSWGCAQAGTGIPISGPKIRFPFAICSHAGTHSRARTHTHTHHLSYVTTCQSYCKIPPSPFEQWVSLCELDLYLVHCWRTVDGASQLSIFIP